MKYTRNFKKIVWGYIAVEAKNLKEANSKFDEADYYEHDNKSDYKFEEWKVEECSS